MYLTSDPPSPLDRVWKIPDFFCILDPSLRSLQALSINLMREEREWSVYCFINILQLNTEDDWARQCDLSSVQCDARYHLTISSTFQRRCWWPANYSALVSHDTNTVNHLIIFSSLNTIRESWSAGPRRWVSREGEIYYTLTNSICEKRNVCL